MSIIIDNTNQSASSTMIFITDNINQSASSSTMIFIIDHISQPGS
jgi:hypothetical protein